MKIRSLQSRIGRTAFRSRRGKAVAEAADGFTLLEVLVALAILSIALVPLLAAFSESLARTHEIRQEDKARAIAQSLLAEKSAADHALEGSTIGRTGDFTWRVTVTPLGDPSLSQTALLTSTVGWIGGKRTVTLNTLLLAQSASLP